MPKDWTEDCLASVAAIAAESTRPRAGAQAPVNAGVTGMATKLLKALAGTPRTDAVVNRTNHGSLYLTFTSEGSVRKVLVDVRGEVGVKVTKQVMRGPNSWDALEQLVLARIPETVADLIRWVATGEIQGD